MSKVTGTHKAISRIRTITQYAFPRQFFNGRDDYFLLFRTQ